MKKHWFYERSGTPDWAAKVLTEYAEFWGKSTTEVVREAITEKAQRVRATIHIGESDNADH